MIAREEKQMKKIEKNSVLCLILISFLFYPSVIVSAESAGGQVSTISGINFIQEKGVPISKNTKVPKSIQEPVKKFLPKTGETIQRYSFVGTSLMMLVFFGFITLRKRDKYEK